MTTGNDRIAVVAVLAIAIGGACAGRSTIDLPPGHLVVSSSTTLDFGLTACGSGSSALVVTISNDEASSAVHWTAKLDGPFAFDGPSSGILAGHDSASVRLHAVVPSSSVAGVPVDGALRFESDGTSRSPVVVPLRVTPQGAMLRLPSVPVDFGDVPLSASSPSLAATVTNDGNLPAEISVEASADVPFVVETRILSLAPGANGDVVMHFVPKAWGAATGTAVLSVRSPVCGAPSALALVGRGTKGVVLTSPGTVDFGAVDCGATAKPRTITIQNTGDAAFSFQAAMTPANIPMTLFPGQGTVGPGASLDLVVTPSAVPVAESSLIAAYLGGTVQITTNAVGDLPHAVSIHEQGRGAVLAVPSPKLVAEADETNTALLPVTNSGNAPVTVSATSLGGELAFGPVVIAAGTTSQVSVTVPANVDLFGKTLPYPLTFSTQGALCKAPASTPTIEVFDRALDIAANADGRWVVQSICVVGHAHRLYCRGPSATLLSSDWPNVDLPSMTAMATGVDRVLMGGEGACIVRGASITCRGYYDYTLDMGSYVSLFGKPRNGRDMICATDLSGALKCSGVNMGRYGNGDTYWDFTPLPAMTPLTDVVDFESGPDSACAVRANGKVVCSGKQAWGSLGDLSVPGGSVVLEPHEVPGIDDAIGISIGTLALQYGATARVCVARTSGAVTCWGSYQSPSGFYAMPVVADATSVLAVNDWTRIVCALRAGGGVRCSDGASDQDIAGFAGPVLRMAGKDHSFLLALLANGRVQRFQPFTPYAPDFLEGFDVP